MMKTGSDQLCFATLAFGAEYRFHARRLVLDMQAHAPDFHMIVLTDRPSEFTAGPKLEVHAYRPHGVLRRYHDKRLLIDLAIPRFRTCVVIDSNSRILEPLPQELDLPEGISAFIAHPLLTHLEHERADVKAMRKRRYASLERETACLTHAAGRLGVGLGQVTFLQESIYAVSGDPGQIRAFTAAWGRLGDFMDHHAMAWSEGYAIGLAAAATGLAIQQHRFLPMQSFYKHRLHGAAVERGTGESPRVVLCHREMKLLASRVRFEAMPKWLRKRIDRVAMGLRWLAFRCRSRKVLRAHGLD